MLCLRSKSRSPAEWQYFRDNNKYQKCVRKLPISMAPSSPVIHYKFVGVIEIPDSGDKYTADTQKGVAIEYVTKSA